MWHETQQARARSHRSLYSPKRQSRKVRVTNRLLSSAACAVVFLLVLSLFYDYGYILLFVVFFFLYKCKLLVFNCPFIGENKRQLRHQLDEEVTGNGRIRFIDQTRLHEDTERDAWSHDDHRRRYLQQSSGRFRQHNDVVLRSGHVHGVSAGKTLWRRKTIRIDQLTVYNYI